MNNTISQDDISHVLMNMDRKKKDERDTAEAYTSSRVTSAIGTNTPMTLLIDIRQSMGELVDAIKTQQEIISHQMQEQQRMHMETIAYIQQLTDAVVKTSAQAPVRLPAHDLRQSIESQVRQDYYHGKDKITTSAHVFACIFIHLERMISRSTSYQGSTALDTTIMELKDWANVVKAVTNAESRQTETQGKLELPKVTSEECKHVLSILASTVPGRGVSSKAEHFSDMAAFCPAVISCTEEIRCRILKCPGLLGQQKSSALMSIEFPYAKDGVILFVKKIPKSLGSRTVLDSVLKLSSKRRDLYAGYILRDLEVPINAVTRAEEYKSI